MSVKTVALTGRSQMRAGLFGPRLWVEETGRFFCPHSGYSPDEYTSWRKASNEDLAQLAAMEDGKNG